MAAEAYGAAGPVIEARSVPGWETNKSWSRRRGSALGLIRATFCVEPPRSTALAHGLQRSPSLLPPLSRRLGASGRGGGLPQVVGRRGRLTRRVGRRAAGRP